MDGVLTNVFYEVAALLVLASAVGMVGLALRQPLIVSFIAVGILAGPSALGVVRSAEPIELLAELGIAVLLFLVGLKLDLNLIRTIGGVSLTTGLGQVAFTSVIGYGICLALGLDSLTSLYVAVALTFSSTIIIVKLLSDKREIDSLHGRIALGFLIVRDLVVVLAMAVLSAFGIGAAGAAAGDVLLVFANGALLLAAVGLFIRYAADRLLERIARAPELLVSFAIGWAAFVAALADFLGFSKELGGLLAGVSLASTPYREAVASRLTSLRDFLLLFFFIGLGSRLDLALIGDQLGAALVLSLFVLVGNPLIVLAIMGAMGYRKRTGFLAGLTVAQISEFSLIFMAMGLTLGHVGPEAVGLVTLVGLVTIGLSTYMILYSQRLYAWFERFLAPFERNVPYREPPESVAATREEGFDAILFGLGRYGSAIYRGLSNHGLRVLGVDFNPEAVRAWRAKGLAAAYGDMLDPEFPAALPLRGARWVISAVPVAATGLTHPDPRATLIHALRGHGFHGEIVVTANDAREAEALQDLGADLVLLPFADAADQAVDLILERGAQRPVRALDAVPA